MFHLITSHAWRQLSLISWSWIKKEAPVNYVLGWNLLSVTQIQSFYRYISPDKFLSFLLSYHFSQYIFNVHIQPMKKMKCSGVNSDLQYSSRTLFLKRALLLAVIFKNKSANLCTEITMTTLKYTPHQQW